MLNCQSFGLTILKLINSNTTDKLIVISIRTNFCDFSRDPLGNLKERFRKKRFCESFILFFSIFQRGFGLRKAEIKNCQIWSLQMGSCMPENVNDCDSVIFEEQKSSMFSEMKKICCFFHFEENNQGHDNVSNTV